MVALEIGDWEHDGSAHPASVTRWPSAPLSRDVRADVIAVVDEHGETIAYVPAGMGEGQARAHAAMIAAAPRLLDLARYAAANVDESSHAGVLRAYRAYCQKVVDEVEDQILVR